MDIRAILMGLAFALMWSSAFTSARIIVTDASPLAALTLRYLLSGLLGVGIAWAMGQSWHLTRAQWRATIVFGILQNAVYLGLNFVAMQSIEASVAAIIASTMPLLVALAGWLFLGERLKPLGIAGLIAGLVGVGLIMGARITGGVDTFGLVLCCIGVIALTVATLSVRGATSGGNFLMVVGLQMLVGCAALALATALFETPRVTPAGLCSLPSSTRRWCRVSLPLSCGSGWSTGSAPPVPRPSIFSIRSSALPSPPCCSVSRWGGRTCSAWRSSRWAFWLFNCPANARDENRSGSGKIALNSRRKLIRSRP